MIVLLINGSQSIWWVLVARTFNIIITHSHFQSDWATHKYKYNINPNAPPQLVLGAVGIFQNLTVLTRKCCSDGVVKCIAICQLPVNIFLIGWFIAGANHYHFKSFFTPHLISFWNHLKVKYIFPMACHVSLSVAGNIWVYGTFSEVQHKNETISSTYCDHTTYWFAFWLITLVYILVGACLIIG